MAPVIIVFAVFTLIVGFVFIGSFAVMLFGVLTNKKPRVYKQSEDDYWDEQMYVTLPTGERRLDLG